MIRIAISRDGALARIALLKAGVLCDYAPWRFECHGDVGDLYCGRILKRLPQLAGSFVELGGISGFLPDSATPPGMSEGSLLLARIQRCAQGGKGPRLEGLPGTVENKPGLLRQGLGPLAEFALRHPDCPIFIDDYELQAHIAGRARRLGMEALAERTLYRAGSFDAVLQDEIAALSEPVAALPENARLHITPAPALTAIDIDSAGAGRGAKPQAQRAFNEAVIPELARQIRLRNLSGAILVDFAGMKSSARPSLLPALRAALATDPLRPNCAGFSHLGFAEISRPRIRPPLHEFQT